jgi:hypothetical protein
MPMIRRLYPDNWKEISLQVREEAGWKCEACGQDCRRPEEPFDSHRRTLTTAHLNRKQWDCSRENLKALCAPCHLLYDASYNQRMRWFWVKLGGGLGPALQLHLFAWGIELGNKIRSRTHGK